MTLRHKIYYRKLIIERRSKLLQAEVTDHKHQTTEGKLYYLSIANLINGLRGLKHNDDVPAHRFQAAGREPQATRRCRCSTKLIFWEHLLCQKYQQSKGEYMVYSARLMAGGVVFCIKPL